MISLNEAEPTVHLGALHSMAAPRGLVVLVVEDDDADAHLIERALSHHPRVGSITRAVDGVEALELITTGLEPDLAIIDLKMPRKSGFSLLLELNCAEWLFPKVVLTSSTVREDAVRSKLRGATQVLIKPNTIEGLQEQLGSAIATV